MLKEKSWWIYDFLSNIKFDVYSENFDIASGAPQGAILSPLLFSILVSDLPTIKEVHSFFYADDISLFSISDDLFTAVYNLQTAINKYSTWFNKLNLNLNSLKSSFMIFTRKKVTCPPTLYLNSTSINLVISQKLLGLILDTLFLTWRKHINYV